MNGSATRGDKFVHAGEDRSVRELTKDERSYLNTDFLPGDDARPYVKSRYEERNGWGNLRGFLLRERVPPHVTIASAGDPQGD